MVVKKLKEKHKLLGKKVRLLEKSRATDRSNETWEALRESKKDKLAVKDEIETIENPINEFKNQFERDNILIEN